MATISQVTSGTQSASLDTEHTLTTETTADIFVLVVNLSNMIAGDVVTLRVKTKVLSSGAETLAFIRTFSGAQTEIVVYSEPVPSAHSIKFTLEQTDSGLATPAGNSYEWSVLKVL